MSKKSLHVVPSPDGGWEVKSKGAKKAAVHTDTKQEAIDAGKKLSLSQGVEFIIHGKTGQILHASSEKNFLSENKVRQAIRNLSKEPIARTYAKKSGAGAAKAVGKSTKK